MKSYMYVLRHGTTEGNIKNWYYGRLDLPLSEQGIEALKTLKAQGIYPSAEGANCYTTGLLRTEQTFQIMFGDVSHETIPTLQEMNFGAWEGMSYEEIGESGIYPEYYERWQRLDMDESNLFQFPEGESVKEFYERIKRGKDELVGKHRLCELSHRHDGKDAVTIMVCHGGVSAAIMHDFFPGKKNFWEWIPEPGHGYIIQFENSEAVSYETI